jgi:hypothetical protein
MESLKLVRLYQNESDWRAVRAIVMDKNTLQQRTERSRKRLYSELQSRLMTLTSDGLELLASGTDTEQRQLLWLAVCRRYRFIYDFAVEVLREKALRLDFQMSYGDWDAFWASKAIIHDELDQVARSTRKKCRQVVFKMMREAGLIGNDNKIQQLFYSDRLIKTIIQTSVADLRVFPVQDGQLQIPGGE